MAEIEHVFPEVLRDPILRKVQFSTISRMDELGTFRMYTLRLTISLTTDYNSQLGVQ